jgi:hypothetical protein
VPAFTFSFADKSPAKRAVFVSTGPYQTRAEDIFVVGCCWSVVVAGGGYGY